MTFGMWFTNSFVGLFIGIIIGYLIGYWWCWVNGEEKQRGKKK